MDKKKEDRKFVLGMVLLVAVMLVVMGGFWTMVARQAELDKLAELQAEVGAVQAIVLTKGENQEQIFFDMEDPEPFYATVPAGIYNRNGVLIKGDVLEYGDKVKIIGGDWEETRPAKLTNITRMERLGRATLEEAASYQAAMDELLAAMEPAS